MSKNRQSTEQAMALAGLLQAVTLVDQLAKTGQAHPQSFRSSLSSVLSLNPGSTEEVFGGIENLQLGLQQLRDMLRHRPQPNGPQIMRYALALLHLQNRMRKDQAMSTVIGDRIEQALRQGQHFGDQLHENVIANLAGIYQDTFSKLNYRIQVIGDAGYLQQTHIANKIRALLLAGIRSAALWRQLGGSRWQLFFKRRKLLREAEALLNA